MRTLTTALLFLLVGGSLLLWLSAPAVQAAHGAWGWFLLPGLAVVLVIGSYVLSAQFEHRPGLLNLPDRTRFEALSSERRLPVIQHARSLMNWLALEIVILMSLIQLGQYYQQGRDQINIFIILALAFGIVVSPVVAMLFLGKMQTEVQRQLRAQSAATGDRQGS